ncbi:MAG: glycosyltransferase family 1 protein [Ferruginibacter sp.]|uniref:glycosyltransferase family 4 protein n=1 Tax=Ferruginibacter sp. TaxID=1940288 RepID=UPI00265AF105|nr:glycosyltransferase family 4 protein [Ferruginibacter sp.]MDB5280528.1 glycosyltransferase family 1 protein [Ferruginibacter sp.]
MASDTIKNVAIVSNTSWYIYNFRKGLLQKLISAGYNVFAIAPKDKFVKEIETLGCVFIELKHIHNKGKNPFHDISLTLELRKIFKANHLDFCFFFTPKINIFGSLAAKFTGIKTVATINGLGFVFSEGQPGWLKFTVEKLYTIAFKNLKAIIFQNNDDKNYFLQNKIIDHRQEIIVVKGSGANLIEFNQKTFFNTGNRLVFLLSARLIKEKGLSEYFEAAKNLKQKYPDITCALLGLEADNPSSIPLQIVEKMHEQKIIDYRGGTDDMSSVLNTIDVMVLPSYYREGIPKILIEALAKGLPVITTNNIGCKETVDNGENGFLIEIKNASALEAAMEKMILMTAEDLARMGKLSRAKAELEFDEAYNHKAYISILNS